MRDFYSYGVHKPRPGKKHKTGLKHISPTPIKTGSSSSGGGTTKGGGRVKTGGGTTHGGNFSMPRPDKNGFY
jgi:hypothetical protein